MGQMVDMFTQMVGKSVEVTLDRSGKTVSVSMGEMGQMMSGLGGGMGGDMSGQMTGIPGSFPETPIFEGLSWPLHQEQQSPMGTLTTDGTMTVRKWDAAGGIATIDFEGAVVHTPAEKRDDAAEQGDMAAQMAAMIKIKEAKTSGQIVFDVGHGRLVTSRSTMSMAMEHPMMGGDMTMEAKVDLSLLN